MSASLSRGPGGRLATIALLSTSALALGGCYVGAPGLDPSSDPASQSVVSSARRAAVFTPYVGKMASTGIVAKTTTKLAAAQLPGTPLVSFEIVSPASTIQTWSNASQGGSGSSSQTLNTTVSSVGGSGMMNGLVESDGGGVYRGGAGTEGSYVAVTNTPTKWLNDSLGATSLSYSYIGVGGLGVHAAGSTGDMNSYAFGLFGGARTAQADMPTTGKAVYNGAFNGLEQAWSGGSGQVVTTRLAGAANMNVDFVAGTVAGRVDYIDRYTPTTGGVDKRATDYSIGFKGQIVGNGFEGRASLTQWGSDNAIAYTTQTGALQGGFFGPRAAEAAGALAVVSNHDATKTLVTGAFGAKKQ